MFGGDLLFARWRRLSLALVVLIVCTVLPQAALPQANAQGYSTTFLPLVMGSSTCTNDELFKPSPRVRYMHTCVIPTRTYDLTWGDDPNIKVEWLLSEHPSVAEDTLWWSQVEPYEGLETTIDPSASAAVLDMAAKIAKAREEMIAQGRLSNQSLDDLTAIARKVESGEVSIQQLELAVGLAFAGPAGWILAGFVVVIVAGVLIYAVLKNRNGVHTGIDWTRLNRFAQYNDQIFTIDQMEENISEGLEHTGNHDDHFLEGTPGRVDQRIRILTEFANESPEPQCQNWGSPGNGTTALWWRNSAGRINVFINSQQDPSRDTAMRRKAMKDLSPGSGGLPYYDTDMSDARCQEALRWLTTRIACYVFKDKAACASLRDPGLNTQTEPAKRQAFRYERQPVAFAA